MRNRKLLYLLIPLIIVVLILIIGVVYLKLNSSPEKIFTNAINNVLGMFETSEEKYTTMKGTMKFTAGINSQEEELQDLLSLLEGSSVELSMEADTKNMIVNGNLDAVLNNQELLNATILLQDEKGYVYLPDFLDKYIELPQENMEYSELTEYYDKIETLDQNSLIEAIKEELIVSISNQELEQKDTTLVLDGQETKVTASVLDLKGQAIITFTKEFLTNLKANEKFQTALGEFKSDVISLIDDMLEDESETSDDIQFIFTIYTKGFLNEFVGFTGKAIDNYFEEANVIEILKHNDGKYEFVSYDEYEGEKQEAFRIGIQDVKESKNKGTRTITMTVDEEQLVITYNYEKQGEQNYFTISTQFEGVAFSVTGSAIEEGKNIRGDFVISVQEETFGKVSLNCEYNFTYDAQVQKVDVQNAVLINEISEEDQTTLITNLQNSKMYQLLEESGLFDSGVGLLDDEPEVSHAGYTLRYNVPDGFELSEYSAEDYKIYVDDKYNAISVAINYDSVEDYMRDLDDTYIMTSEYYEDQKISDVRSYTVNGIEYKLRTITYNDGYSSYANLYFAYELDDEYCYVVEVESEGGNISMDIIKNFLDIDI